MIEIRKMFYFKCLKNLLEIVWMCFFQIWLNSSVNITLREETDFISFLPMSVILIAFTWRGLFSSQITVTKVHIKSVCVHIFFFIFLIHINSHNAQFPTMHMHYITLINAIVKLCLYFELPVKSLLRHCYWHGTLTFLRWKWTSCNTDFSLFNA